MTAIKTEYHKSSNTMYQSPTIKRSQVLVPTNQLYLSND